MIINTINEKAYIGQTVQNVRKRWYDHVSQAKSIKCKQGPLQKAILKYGRDVFKVELLEEGIPRDLLDEIEISYVAKFDTYHNGYNATVGGQRNTGSQKHYVPTKEHIAKRTLAVKGKKYNWSKESLEAVRQAKIGKNNPNYGKKAKRVICEFCNKDVAKNIYVQYHGNKCNQRDSLEC